MGSREVKGYFCLFTFMKKSSFLKRGYISARASLLWLLLTQFSRSAFSVPPSHSWIPVLATLSFSPAHITFLSHLTLGGVLRARQAPLPVTFSSLSGVFGNIRVSPPSLNRSIRECWCTNCSGLVFVQISQGLYHEKLIKDTGEYQGNFY